MKSSIDVEELITSSEDRGIYPVRELFHRIWELSMEVIEFGRRPVLERNGFVYECIDDWEQGGEFPSLRAWVRAKMDEWFQLVDKQRRMDCESQERGEKLVSYRVCRTYGEDGVIGGMFLEEVVNLEELEKELEESDG